MCWILSLTWHDINTYFSYASYHHQKQKIALQKNFFQAVQKQKRSATWRRMFFGREGENYLKFIFSGVSFAPMSFWILLEKWKQIAIRRNLTMNTEIWIRIHREKMWRRYGSKKKNRAKDYQEYIFFQNNMRYLGIA